MTPDIAAVLLIVAVAVGLFVSDRVRMDLVALLTLVALALTGLVTPAEALSGFSNPAVVTVWAVLALSAGLAHTGVASLLGDRIRRLAGAGEARLMAAIMLTAAGLSAVMNSVAVAALLLPVTVDIARRVGRNPSRLLMPLAFATLLGGMNTLIGTPTNILVSEVLHEHGLRPFAMFDFAPIGVPVTLCAVAFVVLAGRRWLLAAQTEREAEPEAVDLAELFGLRERLHTLRLPADSPLAGSTLAASRLGSALGVTVVGIERADGGRVVPIARTVLRAGDRLLVHGRLDRLAELVASAEVVVDHGPPDDASLLSDDMVLAEAVVPPRWRLEGQTARQIGFRRRFGVAILGLRRDGAGLLLDLDTTPLQEGDVILVKGLADRVDSLPRSAGLTVRPVEDLSRYRLQDRLMVVRVPAGSPLVGRSLAESRLAEAYGLVVLGLLHAGETQRLPGEDARVMEGDLLLIEGRRENLRTLAALHDVEVEPDSTLGAHDLEAEGTGLYEVALSPHSTLAGRTLRELRFRDRFGMSVLGVWRAGRAYRTGLRDMVLQLGDALLLYGPRERAGGLALDRDFVLLDAAARPPLRRRKASLAIVIMALALTSAALGWLPLAIAAVAGMAAMVATGCLTMDEAHQAIEWKAVFVIAGMLPLGVALERTGAAQWLAGGLVGAVGPRGPVAVMAGLGLLTLVVSQVMPNPAVAVLLTPIALGAAASMGVSPYPLAMAVAISSSAAFLSPVGHTSNLLVMGPGGYRFADYVRLGLPLAAVVLLVMVVVIPLVWPF